MGTWIVRLTFCRGSVRIRRQRYRGAKYQLMLATCASRNLKGTVAEAVKVQPWRILGADCWTRDSSRFRMNQESWLFAAWVSEACWAHWADTRAALRRCPGP